MAHFVRLVLMVLAILSLLAHGALAYDGVCRSVTDIDDLPPGHWCTTNTNAIYDVLPNPSPPGGLPVSGLMAWSSGVYDTRRDRLLVWGGGDWDYGGNEVYAFDLDGDLALNQSPMTWKRIWGPTDVSLIPVSGGFYETYPDGNPGSRHTYDGIEYLPDLDVIWANGGSLWASGWGSHYTWLFDSASLTWRRKSDKPNGFLDATSAYDPTTGHVFMNSYGSFLEYDPVGDTWVTRGGFSAGFSGSNNAEIDPVHRRYVITGGSGSLGSGYVGVFDLNETGNNLQLRRQLTLGNTEITGSFYPGFTYDSFNHQFVAWDGSAGNTASVYTLNPATWTWTKHLAAATNLVTPTVRYSTGTFGRFRYIPSRNAFILVNHTTQQVYFYKLSPGASPPADSIPPTAPTDFRTR